MLKRRRTLTTPLRDAAALCVGAVSSRHGGGLGGKKGKETGGRGAMGK
jgi:hypothetical protein